MNVKIRETPRLWRFALFVIIAVVLLAYVFRQPPEPAAETSAAAGELDVPGGTLPVTLVTGDDAGPRPDSLADARMARDRSRSQEIEGLAALAANQKLAEETRASAGEQLVGLTQRQARELEAEGLLRARGYPDAVVFLHPDAAEVILKTDVELTAAQAYAVAEVIARTAGLSVQQVTVLPRP